MKATLEFNLPEEQQEHYDAVNGGTYKHCLTEIDYQLRSWTKYGNEFTTPEEALLAARDFLWQCIRDNDLVLE